MFIIHISSTFIAAMIAISYNVLFGFLVAIGGLILGFVLGYRLDKELTKKSSRKNKGRDSLRQPWMDEDEDIVERVDVEEEEDKKEDIPIDNPDEINVDNNNKKEDLDTRKTPPGPTPVCKKCSLPKQWVENRWRCPFCED
ncbi:MAG: hypothetical protein QW728_03915 [Thermoplasmata archaeon]